MKANLVVAVLGKRNSGKTTTWKELFGRPVKTGTKMRRLFLTDTEYVDVFLVSGSPEERYEYVADIIGNNRPRIVLCSMQYREGVTDTLEYFIQHDYLIFAHWLNPGFSDPAAYDDTLELLPVIERSGGAVEVRDGQIDPAERVEEMRQYIYEWASRNGLIQTTAAVNHASLHG